MAREAAAGSEGPETPAGSEAREAAAGSDVREAALSVDGRWIGAALPRKEDPRLLQGRGRFVGDLEPPGTLHAAFARSPVAAGALRSVDLTSALAVPGVVAAFAAADLGLTGLRAVLERPEFHPSTMPILAEDAVRHVAEPVAVVVAEDAYAAEDGAEAVIADIEPGEAVSSLRRALDAAPLHDGVASNVFVDLTMFDDPELDTIVGAAPLVLEEAFTSGRLAALPMEGRACLAEWSDRDDQLVVHVSTQVPHQVRTAIATSLGLPESRVRVVAPDVGGGFGLKCVAGREEIAVAALAHRLRRPVKWVEDRQENLTAAFHAREQEYDIRAAFDADGRILAVDADIRCDVGAYSVFPFTSGVEPLMAATELPGPYKLRHYRVRSRAVATNKAPTAPYRGVSRPQITFVMERLMDKAAARLGLDPAEVRRRNLISKDEFPYTGVTGITYDPGSYRESLDLATERLRAEGWYDLRAAARDEGRLVGIGLSCFSERTAYGTPAFMQRRMAMTPGYDVSHIRMDPSGTVFVTTGTASHGQGHETTFAQIVADQLGLHPDDVRIRQGDTDVGGYGWGTFASRSIVVGGGAARRAAVQLAERIRRAAGQLLEADPADLVLAGGAVAVRGVPAASMPIAEVARIAHFQSYRLDGDHLLEASAAYDPPGTFSNATHAVVVELDPGTGQARILRYIVVEDCGVIINPLVVDGQVRGGVAQGIAAALYEQVHYDESGQPVTATLMDYLVPTATEIPPIEVLHLETPSSHSETGSKGMGEGGTIGAPAAVVNAVNDAAGTQVLDTIPVRPEQILGVLT
ncbi:xanthine dehydrogenase family protein molybdopterin-binding subunit [Nonomuraea turcica]|uniref:xanthine dehydrogenase family protein molybdopterin-binding subunit n=1 Tax=Nonomuraea sp. G32 TaxID=3067274 RepID=UPI00273C87E1|nr:xanthine dehydrogenase family protein molybdopterin-binding subunit [Nonomuraea sp. G32]MDP4502300.1 xanthine dehydrogenase family protein molybdopterin-binding subunit [Nonomuraea sp. G32]